MTNNQIIKDKIEEKYRLIEENFKPDCFVLNKKVVKLTKEIEELQSLCTHTFKDNQCIYCLKTKEE